MAPDGTGIKEFDLPHAGSAPRIITIGSDGNFWFSEHLGNRIGRITPAGVIAEFDIPTPDSQPRATALGRDGNVWFGEFMGGKIGRITPQGVITEFAIPTPNSGPRALAAGPDGNIWFSEFNTGKIGRMTLAGQVTEFTLPGADRGPGDITAGADGNMWFVELNGRADNRVVDGNRVGRITMAGQITEFPMPGATGSPVNIAVGPDRNIWYTKGNKLGRVTPDGSDHRVRRAGRWDGTDRRQRSRAGRPAGGQALVCPVGGEQDRLHELSIAIELVRLRCSHEAAKTRTSQTDLLQDLLRDFAFSWLRLDPCDRRPLPPNLRRLLERVGELQHIQIAMMTADDL